MKRTNVFIDGFNLYYGCLKGTPYKWLDLSKLCGVLLKGNAINHIRYLKGYDFGELVFAQTATTFSLRKLLAAAGELV